jgi:hypothetical protein
LVAQEVNIEQQPLLRLVVMGRKSLPDPAERRRRPYWGYVELVTTKVQDIKDALKEGLGYAQVTGGKKSELFFTLLGCCGMQRSTARRRGASGAGRRRARWARACTAS